ncbi:MAG: hypothetical protein ACI9JP_003088, partial [Granulosicoccus sp.]
GEFSTTSIAISKKMARQILAFAKIGLGQP